MMINKKKTGGGLGWGKPMSKALRVFKSSFFISRQNS